MSKNKKFAFEIIGYLFDHECLSDSDILSLLDKEKCDREIGKSYPYPILLKIRNVGERISQAKKDDLLRCGTEYTRYYSTEFIYKNSIYLITSQWYGPTTTKTDINTPFYEWAKRKVLKKLRY